MYYWQKLSVWELIMRIQGNKVFVISHMTDKEIMTVEQHKKQYEWHDEGTTFKVKKLGKESHRINEVLNCIYNKFSGVKKV